MNSYAKNPQVGDIIFVREGERIKNPSNAIERHLNTRFISKDYGKIIILHSTKSHPIHKGFVKLESVYENKKSYTAVGSNVPYDYYDGISVDEFYQVLEVWGFTPEYETIIKDNKKYRVFAHLDKGLLITCEEYSIPGSSILEFNSIEMYVPNTSKKFHTMSFREITYLGMKERNSKVMVFELLHSNITRALRFFVNNAPIDHNWYNGRPNLWHYEDSFNEAIDYYTTYLRIKEFKDDLCTLWGMQTPEDYKSQLGLE